MRLKLTAPITLMIVFCAALSVRAELKIGYINSQEIFKEYEGTKNAQEKFDKEAAKWEQQASEMQREIKELQAQLEKQSLLLSSERKKEIEDKIRLKLQEYQEFLQEKFGQNGEVAKKNAELTKPIVEKIQKIIDRIAKEEMYDFILDESTGGIIHAQKGYDLTKRVLEELNKEQ